MMRMLMADASHQQNGGEYEHIKIRSIQKDKVVECLQIALELIGM